MVVVRPRKTSHIQFVIRGFGVEECEFSKSNYERQLCGFIKIVGGVSVIENTLERDSIVVHVLTGDRYYFGCLPRSESHTFETCNVSLRTERVSLYVKHCNSSQKVHFKPSERIMCEVILRPC